MTLIYTEDTLNLLTQIHGVDSINNLIKTGVVKQLGEVNYLIIKE